jgi:hypothetical protein
MSTAPSLSEFSSLIRSANIARPYLFYVELTLPPGLHTSGTASSDDVKKLSLFCNAAQTPMLGFSTQDGYFEAGIKRKFIYDFDYQELTLEFYVDQTYTVHKFFERWKDLIISSRRSLAWPDDFTAENFDLHLIDLNGKSNFTYSYKRVTLKNINSITLHHAGGGLVSLPVTFNFESVVTSIAEPTSDIATQTQLDKIKSSYTNPEVYQGLQSNLNKQSIVSGLGGTFA